ncbi:MAG: NAD(P)H-dependent oxidoreductase [Paracoccus sp. (in: a-proteobacteria)]|nr:NAD(P)H-dependent oxidoreductase [Paracoccus sp. (in: a-proteobacteria)]
MSKPKIAIIISSTRDSRFADKPAKWLFDTASKDDRFEFELVDLREFDLPFFNEKASNLWMPSEDDRAVAWQNKIGEFDGYIFLTAEYNRSITGALKNALDQAYKEWNRKPMAVMAYGSVGGARAAEHLRTIAIELQMVPLRNGVHLGMGDFFKVSPLGEDKPMSEVEDHLKGSLESTLDELLWWAEATKAARAKSE